MTASTLTVLLANLVLSPENGFISIRFKHPSYGCRMPRHLSRSIQSCILPSKRIELAASEVCQAHVV
jgi:hypothetical protein